MAEGALAFVRADWAAPPQVNALTSTRRGGVSTGPWATLNLAAHAGDDPAAVAENRRRLRRALALPGAPCWLGQVHGDRVVRARAGGRPARADAAWTDRPGTVCAVLTADCVPLLLCDRAGRRVAAVHVGWRGLAAGIVEAALAVFPVPGAALLAWLGPAISQSAYEVGPEVRDALLAAAPGDAAAFRASGRPNHWLADLPGLVRRRLERAGVAAVSGGDRCTRSEPDTFFSHRRDGTGGRQATLIWLTA